MKRRVRRGKRKTGAREGKAKEKELGKEKVKKKERQLKLVGKYRRRETRQQIFVMKIERQNKRLCLGVNSI